MDYRKMTKKELLLVANFLKSLREDDLELFWNCISSNNKKELESLNTAEKLEVVKTIKDNFREHFEDMGIGNIIRFTNEDKTEGFIVLAHNVKTEIHYFQDTDVAGNRLPLELDNGEFKVNIFIN